MKLILTNGYPYPYPEGLTAEQNESIAQDAPGHRLEIDGVRHFEWLHTVTVEFTYMDQFNKALDLTGWEFYSFRVLEAPTSVRDGYDHPAIVVKDMAYCGFILIP